MEERQKVYIEGVKGRGEEVIKKLINLGGENCHNWDGDSPSIIYYIKEDGIIGACLGRKSTSEKTLKSYKEIKLTSPKSDQDLAGDVEKQPCEENTFGEYVGDVNEPHNEQEKHQEEDIEHLFPKVYIRGMVGRGEEVIQRLVELGGKNSEGLSGENPMRVYCIDIDGSIGGLSFDDFCGCGYDTVFKEEIFLENKEPSQIKTEAKTELHKYPKVYIRGVKDRGKEVIQKLVDLGGENVVKLKGHDEDLLYFIDLEGELSNMKAELFNTEDMTEVFLDEEKASLPKVFIRDVPGRGKDVIQKLVDLGATNPSNHSGDQCRSVFYVNEINKVCFSPESMFDPTGYTEVFLDKSEVPENINGEVEASNIAMVPNEPETFAEAKESDDDFFSSFIKFIKETPDEELFKEWNKHSDLDKSDVKIVDFIKSLQERELEWEDFGPVNGWFINHDCDFERVNNGVSAKRNRDVVPTESLANAMLALCQLLQWRNKMWKEDNCEPNFNDESIYKCSIIVVDGEPLVFIPYSHHRVLSFGSKDSAERFLKLHKSLIKQAGELL